MPSPTIEDGRLELHVLGGSTGESIVVGLPGGGWGVVDCYTPTHVLDFLRARGVKSLEFLCLTHPHDDHYRGLLDILRGMEVRLFWRFAGLSKFELQRLCSVIEYESELDRVPESERGKLLQLLLEGRKRIEAHCEANKHLYPCPLPSQFGRDSAVSIWAVAPTGNRVDSYQDQLRRCFNGDRLRSDRAKMEHNEISSALVLVFGETKIVLGGDVEKAAWKEALEITGNNLASVTAVKVSHHGSPTGYCDGLWSFFSGKKKPVAIVTSFQRHKLPKRVALDHIRPYVSEILGTCISPTDNQFELDEAEDIVSGIYIRQSFKAYPEDRGCGRCSLSFDRNGNYTVLDIAPPAGRYL